MAQINSERILIVDLFRVVAIFMVLVSHVLFTIGPPWSQIAQPHFGIKYFEWKSWGELGVTMFLILSGFSLEYTYGDKQVNFWRFYLKRLIRIYPIYYMSLLVGLGLHVAFAVWGCLHHDQAFILLPNFGYWDFFLALSGFNAFFGKWGGPLVWSSWFIGLIMAIYLFYPAISYGFKRSPLICFMFLFLASLASRIIIGRASILSGNPMQWFPLNRLFEFSVGVFLCKFIKLDFLLGFNKSLQRFSFLSFLSAVSFPLFLIHDPLRRFICLGPRNSTSLVIGITFFLILSITLSKMVLSIDQRIQGWLRYRCFARLNDHSRCLKRNEF